MAIGARRARTCLPSRRSILRVSALASDHEAVREMDCNPVMVGEARAVVVDSRVRVAASER